MLPGETAYQVIGRDGQPLDGEAKLTDPSTVGSAVPDAWWSKADASLRAADHPKKRSTPTESITPPPQPKKAAEDQ